MSASNNHDLRSNHFFQLFLSAITVALAFVAITPVATQQVKLDVLGGPGGNYFEHICGPGRVLVGVSGYTGVWIDNVQAVCARVEATAVADPQTEGPVFGGARPLTNGTFCPRSTVVVAALEADENKDNRFLGYIGVGCTNLSARNFLPAATAMKGSGRLASEPRDTTGSDLFVRPARQQCPVGTVAVGIQGRANRFLDALGLICGPRPTALDLGRSLGNEFSFQSWNFPDRYIRHRGSLGYVEPVPDDLGKKDATFRIVSGLSGKCASFESHNYPGHFLRHQGSRLKLAPRTEDRLFLEDATFCMVQGLGSGLSFESINYPAHYLRHRNFEVWLDPYDGSELFRKDATFQLRPPVGAR